jgi:hypothetical protein
MLSVSPQVLGCQRELECELIVVAFESFGKK